MQPIAPVVFVGLLSGVSAAAPLYGPGRHWIDRVRGGYAAFGARASVGVDLGFDGAVDVEVAMTGTTEVFRSAARASDPRRPRHRNHIDLEIVAMHLAGEIPGLGPITLDAGDGIGNQSRDGPLYSQGGSDELPGDPRHSADFFDLFMEVRLMRRTLHNVTPLRVVAVIDRLPPIGSMFTLDGAPVLFVDTAGRPVLQVVTAADVPTPPGAGPCEPAGADAEAIAAARAEAAQRCNCTHHFGRCARRLVATRAGNGQLNRSCRSQVRRCLAAAVCDGAGPGACGLLAAPGGPAGGLAPRG
jgi:hypothetical protein